VHCCHNSHQYQPQCCCEPQKHPWHIPCPLQHNLSYLKITAWILQNSCKMFELVNARTPTM
jgi:hypothetical protein